MGLFEYGAFTLHSGGSSNFLIDCDALTEPDLGALARVIADKMAFGTVVGIPRGGMKLAKKLDCKVTLRSPVVLIVDDVWSTGASMEEAKAMLLKKNPTLDIQGVVIFARSETPDWVWPLFKMTKGA